MYIYTSIYIYIYIYIYEYIYCYNYKRKSICFWQCLYFVCQSNTKAIDSTLDLLVITTQ